MMQRKLYLLVSAVLLLQSALQAVFDPRTTRQIVIDIDTTLTTCQADVNQNFIGTFTTINSLETALQAGSCSTRFISQADVGLTGFTITTSGAYKLSQNIVFSPVSSAAAITIAADNVTLDLQCFSITQGNATANVDGISVASNLFNITIENGKIQNFTRDGIRVASGSTTIFYRNTTIQNCLYGIFCLGTLASPIVNLQAEGLDLLSNSTAISLTFVNRAVVFNSSFFGNAHAGVELINSFSNSIDSCSLENTGAATGSAFGVSLLNGSNNRVQNCTIDGVSTSDTFSANSAVGILIGATENDDVITNNQISNISTTSSAQPFGIEMQYTFSGSGIVASSANYIQNIEWSPNGNYLLTQGTNGEAALVSLKNNQFFNTTTNFSFPYFGPAMAWSPDGSYLAFSNEIYSFSTGVPVVVASIPPLVNQNITWVAWSPDGAYLAYALAALPPATLNTVAVYKFDGSTTTPVAAASVTLPVNNQFTRVAWSPDGAYVGVAGDSSFIYQFSGNQLVQVIVLGTLINLVWSPNGQFVLTVGSLNASVFRFLGTSIQLQNSITFPPIGSDAQWSPDGQWIAVLHSPSPSVIDFYQFSAAQLNFAFSVNLPTSAASFPSSLSWSLL